MSSKKHLVVITLLFGGLFLLALGLSLASASSVDPLKVTTSDLGNGSNSLFQAISEESYANSIYLPIIYNPLIEGTSKYIVADEGGTVYLGLTTLEIPPGALAENTYINMRQPRYGSTEYNDGISFVALEPSGLTFSKAATLTIGNLNWTEDDYIDVAYFDENEGEWEYLPGVTKTDDSKTVSLSIYHFSEYLAHADEPIYIVFNLPYQYLRPGDLIYSMTEHGGKNSWMTGHVGIYTEVTKLVESVQRDVDSDKDCSKQFTNGGVRKSSLNSFRRDGWGYYLGARRPIGATVENGKKAAKYANDQLGDGYVLTGIGSDNGPKGPDCFSCVGLTEKAWEEANIDIIEDDNIPTPMQQFKRTSPVTDITVAVDEYVEIPVSAVVKVDVSWPFFDYYKKESLTLDNVVGKPDGATFKYDDDWGVRTFKWVPEQGDIRSEPYTITFNYSAIVGEKTESKSQTLKITVEGTLENAPPYEPSGESPTDGATNQSVNVNLSWNGGDPDGDSVTYDVYLGANDPTPNNLICNDVGSTFCNPGTLNHSIHYYWKVVARDEHGATTTGPVWDFTTEPPPEPDVGPIVYESHSIAGGGTGGDDEIADCGVEYELDLTLRNLGIDIATGVAVDFSTNDPYTTVTDSYTSFANIPGGGTSTATANLRFIVSSNVPDGRDIDFDIEITADNGGPWSDSFTIESSCASVGPVVYDGHVIDDDNSGNSSGNNNGQIDCGESIELSAWLLNEGNSTAQYIYTIYSTSDQYVTNMTQPEPYDPDIPGGARILYDPVYFDVASNTPDGHDITFNLNIADDNGNRWYDSFTVNVSCDVGPIVFNYIELFDNNTNEFAGCGESVGVEMDVLVQGGSDVYNVCSTLSTNDAYTVVEDSQYYPSTDCHPWSYSPGELIGLDYGFDVRAGAPNGHVIDFDLDFTADNGGPWHDEFTVTVACPDN